MPSSHEDVSSRSRVGVTSSEAPAVSDSGDGGVPLRDALRRVLWFLKDKLGAQREYIRILVAVISLSLLVAFGIWLAFSGYDIISRYLASRDAEPPTLKSKTEVREDDAGVDYETAKRETQQALAEAERIRQINVAKMEADKYQWATWLHTLRDINDNNRRLREKQRAAEERAAAEQRQARIEAQRKEQEAQEAQRKAAEMAAAARPARASTKKRLRSFD